MPSEPYTPTVDQVRFAWWLAPDNPDDNEGESDLSFDRMIAEVRADEREKCAQIAERIKGSHYPYSMGWDSAERIAAAIRSQTTQEGNRG